MWGVEAGDEEELGDQSSDCVPVAGADDGAGTGLLFPIVQRDRAFLAAKLAEEPFEEAT